MYFSNHNGHESGDYLFLNYNNNKKSEYVLFLFQTDETII